MSALEIYDVRHLDESRWHREDSISRFISPEEAPLAFMEMAEDRGRDHKNASVLKDLSRRSGLPAFVVLYTKAWTRNPFDERFWDMDGFRVKRISLEMDRGWSTFSPEEWARMELKIHQDQVAQLFQIVGGNR
jgi:hypothetical protein